MERKKEDGFLTDGNWWQRKTMLRYTTNHLNILFQHAHLKKANEFFILTYNMQPLNCLEKLNKRKTIVVVNSRFENVIRKYKEKFPNIRFFVNDTLHTKLYCDSSGKILFGSQNFNKSSWHDILFEVNDKKWFNFLKKKIIDPIIDESREVIIKMTSNEIKSFEGFICSVCKKTYKMIPLRGMCECDGELFFFLKEGRENK